VWARNLLFLAVCAGGTALLFLGLAPQPTRPPARDVVALTAAIYDDDFLASVARINAAFLRQWSASGIQPAAKAPDAVIARRMSLALTGTIPSLEELRRFEADNSSLQVWLSERLSDPRSSDYLAERLARATVGVQDGPFLIYRRRRFVSWLADELQANRPFDQIVRSLIAEEGLWTDHPATNFITVTINPDANEGPNENALAARVSRAFLGVRLDCAECHDHPFRNWKQADFQSLAAFFAQTQETFTGIRDRDGEFEVEVAATGETRAVAPRVPFSPELLPADGERRERLAQWITHPANDAFARVTANRAWAILFGRALVEPVDDIPRDEELPEVLRLLADDFVAHAYDLRRLLAVIASTEAFALDSRHPLADGEITNGDSTNSQGTNAWQQTASAWGAFPITRLRPEQVVGSLLQAASLRTIDRDSHILVRFARTVGQNEFVERYGGAGEEEFRPQGGAIPQRLLLMNGKLVEDKTKDSLLGNAASQIASLAPDDETAVEVAYLSCLSRRPTPDEAAHFQTRLAATTGGERRERLGDLYWSLINSTEFSWNH
jgi:hypothetical protein